jgi:hypothetical protein
MDALHLGNPYHPDDPLAPFAGRQTEVARIDHYLKDTTAVHALTVLGWRWLGKTALLRRFDALFDDAHIGVYVPLRGVALNHESDLLRAVIETAVQALTDRSLTLSRLPTPPDTAFGWHEWFAEAWLPAALHLIRPHRRLVLLLDDAHHWYDRISAQGWSDETVALLARLLREHPQFKIVLTCAAEREDVLLRLAPLVSPTQVIRLTQLSLDSVRWLLRHPGLYNVMDESINSVHRLTGGHPRLLQRYASAIYAYQAEHPEVTTITPEIARALTPTVYAQSRADLEAIWDSAGDTEQLVLLAYSRLRYEDPLKPVTAETIAQWLVDSDYPLDLTAVRAALRGLEYREIIALHPPGYELTASLLQTWLLDHTRKATSSRSTGLRLRAPVLIGLIILVALALLLLTRLSSTPQPPADSTPPPGPTVTLALDAPE